mmetsp:Transcript_23643/g.47946  ORF Transcript_23643/g.47946 Transcript_23643/m.47946 type:complete len:220 (+) Transcript_23643:556-1215(+)
MKKLSPLGESTEGTGKLEGPQEVVGLLELGSDSGDLMNEVSAAVDSGLTESLADDRVVGDGDALAVDLGESALVNELLNSGAAGVSVRDVGLDESEHTDGGLIHSDEGGVVDLTETEQLHDLLGLGANSDDTADADDQGELGLSRDVESPRGLGGAALGDGLVLGGLILGLVLRGVGGEGLLVGRLLRLGGLGGGEGVRGDLGLGLLLLEDGLGDLHCC